MKKNILMGFFLFLLFCGTLPAQIQPKVKAWQVPLRYVESSQGMDLKMEGGRTELEMEDLDQDGNIDIISIGDHGCPNVNSQEHGVLVWFGNGAGSWSLNMVGNFGYGGIAAGDVNNDGKVDIGYGMHHNYSGEDFGDQLLEVALGDGTGRNFTAWDDGLGTNGETWGMFCTDFADVDGDGDLDIAANSFGAGAGVHVYLNNMDGSWTQSYGFVGGNSNDDIVFGDINNDGIADLCVCHEYGSVYLGDGAGGFTSCEGNLPPAGSMGRRGADLGDVNNDGFDDISFVLSGGIQVWKWKGNNQWENVSGTLPATGSYAFTQLCDMNGDGFRDVAAYGGGEVAVYKGDGNGTWIKASSFTIPSSRESNAFRVGGDGDHNGYPDIVLVNSEGGIFSARNYIRFFKQVSSPESLSVRLVSPGSYRTWRRGTVAFIEWQSGVPHDVSTDVTLELSVTGASGPFRTIASNLPNNGKYQCIVDSPAISQNCYIRVTVSSSQYSVSDINDAPFRIRD